MGCHPSRKARGLPLRRRPERSDGYLIIALQDKVGGLFEQPQAFYEKESNRLKVVE